jgi:signal transduction histidine kinase
VRERLRRTAIYTALVFFGGLLTFTVYTTAGLAEGSRLPWRVPFVSEMTAAFTFLLLLPVLLAFMRRFPLEPPFVWKRLPLHLVAVFVFAPTHTLLMWGSRTLVYRLLGWGAYDYGDMRYRFLMEGEKQLLLYALVLGIVTFLERARRSRDEDVRAARLVEELSEARLAALKSQLQPHFLFNTLNTIAALVHEDADAADAMLGHLSDFLRLTLKHADAQEVPLASELEALRAYLAIMDARFGSRLHVELDVPNGTGAALVPHLVLQPIVENAVLHCTAAHDREGRIRVSAHARGGRLVLSVEDNGPGVAGDPKGAVGRGVGLTNTAARLAQLYGKEQALALENRAEGGLSVRVEIPLHEASVA